VHKVQVFFRDEAGQDLSEYCMLLALIVLVAAGIFLKVSGGVGSLWTVANSTLNATSATGAVTSGATAH
jgi:Flp pilus assembly pilin Flp